MVDNEMKPGTSLEGAGGQVTARIHDPAAPAARESATIEVEDSGTEHGLDWREITRILFVAAAAGAAWRLGPRHSLSFPIAAWSRRLLAGIRAHYAGVSPFQIIFLATNQDFRPSKVVR